MNSHFLEVMLSVFEFLFMRRTRLYIVCKEDGTLGMKYCMILRNRLRSFSPFRLLKQIDGLCCVMIYKDLWRVYSIE